MVNMGSNPVWGSIFCCSLICGTARQGSRKRCFSACKQAHDGKLPTWASRALILWDTTMERKVDCRYASVGAEASGQRSRLLCGPVSSVGRAPVFIQAGSVVGSNPSRVCTVPIDSIGRTAVWSGELRVQVPLGTSFQSHIFLLRKVEPFDIAVALPFLG
mgnify:CR=1 FL=1